MKSAPAIIQTIDARATFLRLPNSPVAKMVLRCASPQADRNALTSLKSSRQFCVSTCLREITISISLAPAATLSLISNNRVLKGDRPAGKPVETAATGMPLLPRAVIAVPIISWYTHIAPT